MLTSKCFLLSAWWGPLSQTDPKIKNVKRPPYGHCRGSGRGMRHVRLRRSASGTIFIHKRSNNLLYLWPPSGRFNAYEVCIIVIGWRLMVSTGQPWLGLRWKDLKLKQNFNPLENGPEAEGIIDNFAQKSWSFFGSVRSSRIHNLCLFVRLSGSNLSRAHNLHHSDSGLS